ncbi:MAG: NAD(P)H-dependent oxidoreductase [Bacillota bacterium]
MRTLLFINGCVRGENSRTLKLANAYIDAVKASGEVDVITHDLGVENIGYMKSDSFDIATGEQKPASCELAKEFAAADEVVLAAPYWEFLFPAVVNCYFEAVSVAGETFKYTEKGSVGLCKAKNLKYIYTAGAYLGQDDKLCEEYVKKLANLYGIKNFSTILLDGLDIWGNNPEKMVADACEKIKKLK